MLLWLVTFEPIILSALGNGNVSMNFLASIFNCLCVLPKQGQLFLIPSVIKISILVCTSLLYKIEHLCVCTRSTPPQPLSD